MSQIKVVPLGAGQDVGRSCIIVSLGGKNIMFDCGMHMGYNDERRFPNFKYLSPEGNFDQVIDVVIISHFHLDHCGALPYFTEMCGYNGPVVMTYPTKAVCPILLEDFRKITVERKGETNFFTSANIKDCMKKVIGVNIHQTVNIGDDIQVKAFYAGHVLGAAMFYVKVGQFSCLYTGDYNMTPDRHLGAAQIDKLKVDLLITETTYATTIRDSKRLRERDFLKKVHEAVERGGKVLIPVFALGRAQELCILIETYWERMNLAHVPVYFSAGLVEKANLYYKLFINWTNQKIKDSFVKHNMFDFKHIKPFERIYADKPGPMVLFATPGMLHAGMSLEVFKKWCGNELNVCILPGYCVAGTVGNKILSGSKRVEIDKKTQVDVRLQVQSLSFSAHADAKGIMQLIQQCEPKNVLLVHGEKGKMQFLKERIKTEFGIPCYDPANGEVLTINLAPSIPVDISRVLLKEHQRSFISRPRQDEEDDLQEYSDEEEFFRAPIAKKMKFDNRTQMDIDGILVMDGILPEASTSNSQTTPSPFAPKSSQSQSPQVPILRLIHPNEAQAALGIPEHTLSFSVEKEANGIGFIELRQLLQDRIPASAVLESADQKSEYTLNWNSISARNTGDKILVSWEYADDELAEWVLQRIDSFSKKMFYKQ